MLISLKKVNASLNAFNRHPAIARLSLLASVITLIGGFYVIRNGILREFGQSTSIILMVIALSIIFDPNCWRASIKK